MKKIRYNFGNALSDCRGTGKSRGFNACTVYEERCVGKLLDDKFVVVLMGAVAGEGCNDLTYRDGRNGAFRCSAYVVESYCGRVGRFFVVMIVRGRSD